jgi:lysozyme family protein
MANLEKLIPLILKWEGGYVNDPEDSGGPTKTGVTLKTWRAQGYDKDGDGDIDVDDLKLITGDDVINRILRPHYWNRWQADRIRNQSIANILVDWVWGSGSYGIRIPQVVLKVKIDGIVGEKTLEALNNYPDQRALFDRIKTERIAFIERICVSRPANLRFRKGWLNRLADFRFHPTVVCILALVFCLGGCKSVPPETKAHTVSETKERVDRDVTVSDDRQSDRNTETRSFTDSEENSVSQTRITHYDTALPKDTVTGVYPVKSVVETVTVKGAKINRRDAASRVSTVRELSRQTDKSQTVMQKAAEVRQQQSVKDPYRWRYIALAVVAAVIGIFLKRKILSWRP